MKKEKKNKAASEMGKLSWESRAKKTGLSQNEYMRLVRSGQSPLKLAKKRATLTKVQ